MGVTDLVGGRVTAAEKLKALESSLKTDDIEEWEGAMINLAEAMADALPQIVAVVEAVPALLDCPNLDAPYHTSLNCNFCSAAPVREGRAALAALEEALA